MPEPVSEAGLQGRIVRAIKKRHPSAWIFHPVGGPYQVSGIPDLLMCIDGMFIGIEIKWVKPGESVEHALSRVTPQQAQNLRTIEAAGGTAGPALSVQDALDIIDRAYRKAEKENH